VLFSSSVFGQQYSISGEVIDEQGEPISYATVLLLKSVVKSLDTSSGFVEPIGTITDEKGFFEFNELKEWGYSLNVSFIGYKTESKTVQLFKNENFDIVLKEAAESLGEVQLTYKKPTLKKEADRLIFNVANTALIEGTILQVLKSTPGILVLESGITIKGSEPAVYINNKKVQITSRELMQLLESSSANSIKSIEVITNPSAKYDADSGTVVNIVMSKNLISGYRGSVFANYTQGVFPRHNVGTSHFFKNQKTRFNLNYSYTNNKINRDGVNVVNYLDNDNAVEEIWKSTINRNTWS